MRRFLGAFLWVAALVNAASPAGAAIIYSTFGPSQSYDTTQYAFVRGAAGVPGSPYQGYASAFTAADNFSVTRVDVALAVFGSLMPNLLGSFWTDAAGVPETQIGNSFAISALSKFFAVSTAAIAGVGLTAGQTYFLVLQPAEASSSTIWFLNSIGALAPAAVSDSTGFSAVAGLSRAPAFDVIGVTSIPEPDSIALIGFGIALMAGALRNHNRRPASRSNPVSGTASRWPG